MRFPGLKQSQVCGQTTSIRSAATTGKSEQLLDSQLFCFGIFFPDLCYHLKQSKKISLPEKKANYPSR